MKKDGLSGSYRAWNIHQAGGDLWVFSWKDTAGFSGYSTHRSRSRAVAEWAFGQGYDARHPKICEQIFETRRRAHRAIAKVSA